MAREDHAHLLDALGAIDPAELDYQGWCDVGMALHESGYDWTDWDEWSRRDQRRYHEGECRSKWSGFGNGSERVTSGTIIHMAEQRGWRQPTAGEGQALDWDDVGTVTSGPDATNADSMPIVDTEDGTEWDASRMLSDYLEALFDDDELVGYVCDSWERDGRLMPKQGHWDRTAGELRRELSKTSDVGAVMGDWDERAGAWIRFNPLDGNGCGNANVTDFRYALVESDVLDVDKQFPAIKELHLPCVAVVSSGGKSVHAIVRVDAKDKTEYEKRVRWLYDYCDRHGFVVDRANKNASRLSRMPGATRDGRRQLLLATNIGEDGWDAWKKWAEESEDDLPDVENVLERLDRNEPLAEVIIGLDDEHGILRRGHKMLVQGPSKAGKSMLLTELAIAVACGGTWLGYPCRQGRVLYVNLEIDARSMDRRIRRIASEPTSSANGPSDPMLANMEVWNLRGMACPMDKLAPKLVRRMLMGSAYSMVIIDPIYKVITGDENSATDMALFGNQFDYVATRTGASVVYCHHHSKGVQGGKRAIDRGSGSGVFGRDPDAVLDLAPLELTEDRQRQLEGTTCWRIETTLREFDEPKPIDLYFRFPVHVVDHNGDLTRYKVEGEDPFLKNKERREKAKKERYEKDQNVKNALIEEAYQACVDDGMKPTRDNLLEYIGEYDGKAVSDGQLKAWTTPSKSPWTKFRCVEQTSKRGKRLFVIEPREE